MDPAHRKLILVTIENALAAERVFKILMGENVEQRKNWIDDNVKFTLEDEHSEFWLKDKPEETVKETEDQEIIEE